MRIGNFEFGLSKPFGFRMNYSGSSENACKCTIMEFGPFHFTILRATCAERVKQEEKTQDTISVPILGLLAQIERDMYQPSKIRSLPPAKVKKAKAALKRLNLNVKSKRKKKKNAVNKKRS